MKYHLAQLNIARFLKPADHPDNAGFVNSLDRVNAAADAQPGFVWRQIDDGNDAPDARTFDDPNMIVNLSVWTDIESLAAFVYRNEDHLSVMRRRREWFERMDFHLVLWWVEEGHIPTEAEAMDRLASLMANGPGPGAFTFRQPYAPPDGNGVRPVVDANA